jgi:hypothetical protein
VGSVVPQTQKQEVRNLATLLFNVLSHRNSPQTHLRYYRDRSPDPPALRLAAAGQLAGNRAKRPRPSHDIQAVHFRRFPQSNHSRPPTPRGFPGGMTRSGLYTFSPVLRHIAVSIRELSSTTRICMSRPRQKVAPQPGAGCSFVISRQKKTVSSTSPRRFAERQSYITCS